MVMPGMNGIQVLAELRSRTETSDLPVIVVTARDDAAAAVEALAAGADDHLAKPFDFDVLVARIERTLARGRRIADLKRSNAALDARIAARAMELGEARAELADVRADRQRLAAEMDAPARCLTAQPVLADEIGRDADRGQHADPDDRIERPGLVAHSHSPRTFIP